MNHAAADDSEDGDGEDFTGPCEETEDAEFKDAVPGLTSSHWYTNSDITC